MNMTLSEYLTDVTKIGKPVQIINSNYDVLYYGTRDEAKIPYNCASLLVVKEENILGAADCVTVEYDT